MMNSARFGGLFLAVRLVVGGWGLAAEAAKAGALPTARHLSYDKDARIGGWPCPCPMQCCSWVLTSLLPPMRCPASITRRPAVRCCCPVIKERAWSKTASTARSAPVRSWSSNGASSPPRPRPVHSGLHLGSSAQLRRTDYLPGKRQRHKPGCGSCPRDDDPSPPPALGGSVRARATIPGRRGLGWV